MSRLCLVGRFAIAAGALLFLPIPAAAQLAGIVVEATAASRIPATYARLDLTFSTPDFAHKVGRDAIQPIFDALVSSGVDPADISWPINLNAPGGTNAASIAALVTDPTPAKMQAIVDGIVAALPSLKNLTLTSTTIQARAEHCQLKLNDVRAEAIANAHAQAESIAKNLGVRLGPAIRAQTNDHVDQDGSCSMGASITGFYAKGVTPQTAAEYLQVLVSTDMTVTYAIK